MCLPDEEIVANFASGMTSHMLIDCPANESKAMYASCGFLVVTGDGARESFLTVRSGSVCFKHEPSDIEIEYHTRAERCFRSLVVATTNNVRVKWTGLLLFLFLFPPLSLPVIL